MFREIREGPTLCNGASCFLQEQEFLAISVPCEKHFFRRGALSQRIFFCSVSLSASTFAKSSFRISTFFCLNTCKTKAMLEMPSLCSQGKSWSQTGIWLVEPLGTWAFSVFFWRLIVEGQVDYGKLNLHNHLFNKRTLLLSLMFDYRYMWNALAYFWIK